MPNIDDTDAWAAAVRAHNNKLYEELVAETNADLETEKDPFERQQHIDRLARLDAIKARTEAPY
jgi:hypothetical protein